MKLMTKKIIIVMVAVLIVCGVSFTANAALVVSVKSGDATDAIIHGSANIMKDPLLQPYSYGAFLAGKNSDAASGPVGIGTGTSWTNQVSTTLKIGNKTVPNKTKTTTTKKVNIKVKLNGFKEDSKTATY